MIITGTSLHSPQAVITATIAKAYGVQCTIGYGGTTEENLRKTRYANLCRKLGADVEILAKSGRTSILQSKINQRLLLTNEFNIRYGFDLRNNLDVFVQSVGEQAQNLPDELDNIVITVGSSITLIGLLYGLTRYNKRVKRIYAIGCAPNRMEKIRGYVAMLNEYFGMRITLDNVVYVDAFNQYKGFKYEDEHNEQFCDIRFHPRYEAKTFRWLRARPEIISQNTLMWITGSDFV